MNTSTQASLASKAYDQLVTQITRLHLQPGSVLAEKSLVDTLNIGRTPVREALQRLAIEGLVVHRLNRGMFVSEITYSNIQEVYEFRSLIDARACRLAAIRASEDQKAELMKIHKSLADATQRDDIDAYVELDREYYRVLCAACGNSFVAETIPKIFNLHLRLWFYLSKKLGSWHSIAEAHEVMTQEVSEAIYDCDPDRAEIAMLNYISQRQHDLRKIF
ncbi:MAG: GntR family transcriptional regulator [Acidiferrobacterales bacterium]|nr:GntR family transcriptional regulator [Acidiferrobacterales bacterium]